MEARSASVSPAAARIFWTMAFFARPYSSISPAVAPAHFFTAAYCCRAAGLHADLLYAKPGDALRASAGPARTQARPAAQAGGPQMGQPGGIRQQLGYPPRARHGDDRPDPAAGQRQPLPRPICCGTARHRTHNPIFSLGVPIIRTLALLAISRATASHPGGHRAGGPGDCRLHWCAGLATIGSGGGWAAGWGCASGTRMTGSQHGWSMLWCRSASLSRGGGSAKIHDPM